MLGAESNVVHSYAAIAIERLLSLRQAGAPRFQPAELASWLQTLLERLFGAFAFPDSAENEYVMKAIMRVISFVGTRGKKESVCAGSDDCDRSINLARL